MKTKTFKRVITAAAVLVMVSGVSVGGAFAVDATTLAKNVSTLKTTNACEGCDFTGYNFMVSGISMVNKNLKKAKLGGCSFMAMTNLTGMDITGATLTNSTSFASANLTGVKGLPTVPPVLPPAGTGVSLNAVFLNATWVDGKKCIAPSVGTCNR